MKKKTTLNNAFSYMDKYVDISLQHRSITSRIRKMKESWTCVFANCLYDPLKDIDLVKDNKISPIIRAKKMNAEKMEQIIHKLKSIAFEKPISNNKNDLLLIQWHWHRIGYLWRETIFNWKMVRIQYEIGIKKHEKIIAKWKKEKTLLI